MGGVEKRSSTPNGHLSRFGRPDVEMKEVGWLVGRFRGADFVCSSMFPGCSHGCSHFVGGPCVRMFSLHGFHFVLRHFVFDICRFLSLNSTETRVVLRLRKLKL